MIWSPLHGPFSYHYKHQRGKNKMQSFLIPEKNVTRQHHSVVYQNNAQCILYWKHIRFLPLCATLEDISNFLMNCTAFTQTFSGKCRNYRLTLAPLGGGGGGPKGPPLWFFANSSWSTGNFALKLAIPLRATIPHLVSKNYDPGHNRSAVSDVRVTSCFADFDQQNGFTGIAATGAVLKLRSIDLYEMT